MRLYFLLMMTVCLGYYLLILFYTKRFRSTFLNFWLLAGMIHAALGALWNWLPYTIQAIATMIVLVIWIIFLGVEIQIVRAMRTKNPCVPEYLIVLGAQVRGTYITNSLRRRLDTACRVWKQHPEIKIIVSGGKGRGEDISEAEAMSGYLLQSGIKENKILKEDCSSSTRENLMFSKKLITDESSSVGIVTNDFHIYRSLFLARECGFQQVCGIPASTNRVLFMNYMVREFFAILWMKITK